MRGSQKNSCCNPLHKDSLWEAPNRIPVVIHYIRIPYERLPTTTTTTTTTIITIFFSCFNVSIWHLTTPWHLFPSGGTHLSLGESDIPTPRSPALWSFDTISSEAMYLGNGVASHEKLLRPLFRRLIRNNHLGAQVARGRFCCSR